MTRARTVAPLDLERDRRIIPRLYVRLVLSGAALLSAWGLMSGGGVPLAGGARARVTGVAAWPLAVAHAAVAGALLSGPARRVGAAGLAALLLGWMAFLGTGARYAPAVVVAALLPLALQAGRAEDEGPWRPRSRGWPREAGLVLALAGLGSLGRFLLGGPGVAALLLAGAGLHARSLRRLGAPRAFARVLLLWILLFHVGAGGLWRVATHVAARTATTASVGGGGGTLLALQAIAVVLAWAGFWFRGRLWPATAVAAAGVGYAGLRAGGGEARATLAAAHGNAAAAAWLDGAVLPAALLVLAVAAELARLRASVVNPRTPGG